MSEITEQKGVSTSTPSALRRWFLSRLVSHMASEKTLNRARKRAEAKRVRDQRRHVVEYFHQVDDGYSHLAIQVLARLTQTYDIDLVTHLVPSLRDDNFPEPDLLAEMSRTDAAAIAPYYGLEFPAAETLPTKGLVTQASAILSRLSGDEFAKTGVRVSDCLWRHDASGLQALVTEFGAGSPSEVEAKLNAGADRRKELKHYSGAMFFYEGEWYWGVDRLYHLEERLRSLKATRNGGAEMVAPRPRMPEVFPEAASTFTMEYFPSLRSPYTAVSWHPTMNLVETSGVRLSMRPVLPMVMRGVPATLEKGFYIFKDAAREARSLGVDYGGFHDPIGEPVKMGYSLYMWALGQGKGDDLLEAFLSAAFAKRINTTRMSGMKKVVEMAGLDWAQAQHHLEDDTWQETLEENRLAMYGFGSWGVPSYRLYDGEGNEVLGVWGQDRLWLIAKKLEELA